MNTYAKVASANRHKVRSLYVLAALYVLIGLGVATVSAVNGEPLGAFLGFLIVSCTIGGTALLRAVWRLNAQAAALSDRLAALSAVTHRLERKGSEPDAAVLDSSDGAVRTLDLASIGVGNPSLLAAAVLDQASYPRLAKAIDESTEAATNVDGASTADAPNHSANVEHLAASGDQGHGRPGHDPQPTCKVIDNGAVPSMPRMDQEALQSLPSGTAEAERDQQARSASLPDRTSHVMMPRWKAAYHEGDLAACRQVFAAFEPIADADIVRLMREQLDEVVQRTERRLRMQFQQLVRQQRFEESLRVGIEIARLFPDRPIALEFARIKPHVEKRAAQSSTPQVSSAAS